MLARPHPPWVSVVPSERKPLIRPQRPVAQLIERRATGSLDQQLLGVEDETSATRLGVCACHHAKARDALHAVFYGGSVRDLTDVKDAAVRHALWR